MVSHHVSLCCLFAGAWERPSHPVWEWLQFLVPSRLHRVDRGCLHHAEVWGLRRVGLRQVPVHQKHSPCEVQAIACSIMKHESPHLHASPPWHNRYWPLDLDRISYMYIYTILSGWRSNMCWSYVCCSFSQPTGQLPASVFWQHSMHNPYVALPSDTCMDWCVELCVLCLSLNNF